MNARKFQSEKDLFFGAVIWGTIIMCIGMTLFTVSGIHQP